MQPIDVDEFLARALSGLEAKDPLTAEHSRRCGALAVRVGERLGVVGGELHTLELGAVLHDLGKVDIPDAVLLKPARLDDFERSIMQEHVVIGDEMISTHAALIELAPMIRWHHEHPDGSGYPDGLVGDEIPLNARIVAVCDAYDAITSTRVYREGSGKDRAIDVLTTFAGSQFCAASAEALIDVVS